MPHFKEDNVTKFSPKQPKKPGIKIAQTLTGKKKSRKLSKSATIEPALKDISIKNDFLEASRPSQNE